MPIRWYQSKLASRPFLTQVVTTAVLFGAGDILAQQAVEKAGLEKHNYARTGRMVLYGGAVFGPAATTWFRFLSTHVNLSTKPRTLAIRVGLDQLVFTPTNLALFLSYMAYMEGSSVKHRLKDAYVPILKTNWMVWPVVQVANFGFVPLEHRVLVVNVVALGWNCYLSYMNARD